MSNGGSLELILAALKEWGGYFVWPDGEGEEYVIIARRNFDDRLQVKGEEQLDLLKGAREFTADRERPWTADDILEKINRDLALYQLQRAEEEETNLGEEEMGTEIPLPPKASTFAEASADKQGKTVRFEPLRGDLSPELQE